MSELVFNWDLEQPKRIDPEFKKIWVAALRSGKYKQGFRRLKYWFDNSNRYCCLGVAADLKCDNLPEGSTKVAWHHDTILMVWDEAEETYIEEESLLPSVLSRQLGLTGSDAVVASWDIKDNSFPVPEFVVLSLTDLNDNGMPFNQIADIIKYFL